MSNETLEALDPAGNGLRVAFAWHGDRFHHSIQGMSHGEPMLLAESVEGGADNPWPPSPPLQQLHKQCNDSGGEILLLTGMAGSSHWSGSVTATVGESGPEVTFDLACRHRMKPHWLGVTYRLGEGVEAEMIGEVVTLKVEKSFTWSIHVGETVSSTRCTAAGEYLRIGLPSIAPVPQSTNARTNRWEYAIRPAG